VDRVERERLIEGAKTVLRGNDLGKTTKPAPDLYPHQWNWDSCFIALGLAHVDIQRAQAELLGLLRGQWKNGLVPQIVFNPEGEGYFPGPDVWQCRRSPDAPTDVETSGITQPPVLATAALGIWQLASDKDDATKFLQRVYPDILRYHRFFYEQRDPDHRGLVIVVHPWESGLDNSPPYLDAGSRVKMSYKPSYERLDLLHVAAKNRPTNKDYDLYVYLLEQMRAVDWDQKRYLETAPLQVEDVLFNSILCRANSDLAAIADIIKEDSGQAHEWHTMTRDAINDRLWDEESGTYFSRDRVAGELLRDDTIGAFHTLYGSICSKQRAEQLVQNHLLNASSYFPKNGYPTPTTSMSSPWFNPENYWLGPVWVNTNWMLIHGLASYGYLDVARDMANKTLQLVAQSGYREYFNPLTGEGYGTNSFSWTAALTIDLLERPV
jgi:neutral trehalase